jgi:hypothetical protein
MVSDLTINYSKSSFTPFNLSPQEIVTTTLITRCRIQALPITYLGMPLTITKPSRELYFSIIKREEINCKGGRGN